MTVPVTRRNENVRAFSKEPEGVAAVKLKMDDQCAWCREVEFG